MWLTETNPGLSLPQQKIRVIARADYSGSTHIFTSALSFFSAEWNQTYGTFAEGLDEFDNPINWDPHVVQLFGRTTRGMTGMIFSAKFSIGYMSVAETVSQNFVYALINKAGNAVNVNPQVTHQVGHQAREISMLSMLF